MLAFLTIQKKLFSKNMFLVEIDRLLNQFTGDSKIEK